MTVSGNPVEYILVFWAGVLLSFTPCVWPVMPITISYIGAKAGSSKLRGFLLSLIYVSGIAVIYSILGIIASLTGKLFGRVSSHPVTHIAAGIIIVIFGFSMLDLFTLRLPSLTRLPVHSKKGYFSTLVFGLASGLVVSPCVSPALGAILAYAATKKNILYGATLLFVFAYGMGTVLIFLGTFSALIVNLPKSAKFMNAVKKLLAFILLGMGTYFIISAIRRF